MTIQKPPAKIWLQYYGDSAYWDNPNVPQKDEETTWADEPVHDSDVLYIRADVAAELIKAKDRAAREECAGICGDIAREFRSTTAESCKKQILETMK
jgi:hypothetical protein